MTTSTILFVPEWPAMDSPILDAQVLSVGSFLKRLDIDCIFVGAEVSSQRAEMATNRIEKDFGLEARVYCCLRDQPRGMDMWRACRKAYKRARDDFASSTITHVYARSIVGAYWGRRMAKSWRAVSIFDVRGLIGEEQRLRDRCTLKARLLAMAEYREIRKADRIATVSSTLKEYVAQRVGRSDAIVIPSCYDERRVHFDKDARRNIRGRLRLHDDDIVFCYAGGMSPWQRVDDIARVMSAVCRAERRCRMLILTKEIREAERILSEARFPDDRVFLCCCEHDEIFRFLSAADVGLIMRHTTAVNIVASPVKVAEYLGCGLPLIMTSGIGDYSSLLPANGLGYLLDETGDITQQILAFVGQEGFPELKAAAIAFAEANLTMQANVGQYRQLYRL